jgi:hypothetical protein
LTAVGDGKKNVGRLFVWAIPILTMFSPGELRPEPPTEAALLRQLAVDQGGARLQGQDHSHQPKNDSGHRDPKQPLSDFILAYAPASEGQSLQGREPTFNSNRRLNGCHAAPAMPLKRAFGAWPLRNRPGGGRSRNAKRPGALTGIDLAESAV